MFPILSSPIPVGNPPPTNDRHVIQFVYGQLAIGRHDHDIVNSLVTRGMPSDRASYLVQSARGQRVASLRIRGRKRIKSGLIAILVGIAITIGTLLAAAPGVTGGFYVVSFGPILFGLSYLALGLSDRTKH